jgi:hypothetical protein
VLACWPTKGAVADLVRRGRADPEVAAQLELSLLEIEDPTVEQRAGARLRVEHHANVRMLREALTEPG